jgi:hypothetical protein
VEEKTLFDLAASKAAKVAGMDLAGDNRSNILHTARCIAREIALGKKDRRVTADDVQARMIKEGYHPSKLGPAAGSIFRGKKWRFTGSWINSARVSNHAASIRVWEYMGN